MCCGVSRELMGERQELNRLGSYVGGDAKVDALASGKVAEVCFDFFRTILSIKLGQLFGFLFKSCLEPCVTAGCCSQLHGPDGPEGGQAGLSDTAIFWTLVIMISIVKIIIVIFSSTCHSETSSSSLRHVDRKVPSWQPLSPIRQPMSEMQTWV